MNRAKQLISLASSCTMAILTGIKIWADYRKHATHGKHSQRCDCFSQCLPCATEAIRAGASGLKSHD